MIQPYGCWTCKVRRKKCDNRDGNECETCQYLQITCHRGAKPVWMDGGRRQDDMAQQFKREVRIRSHDRLASRGHREFHASIAYGNAVGTPVAPIKVEVTNNTTQDLPMCPFSASPTQESVLQTKIQGPFSETVLLSFYLDNVLPFLLPFYRPDLQREGGRAWILELASSSPVIRGVILCQSSYFFALSEGASNEEWDAIVAQSANTFRMLYQATDIMTRTNVQTQLRGAVRMFVGIMQMQRFEVCLSSFENCRAHLDMALELFCGILACAKEQVRHNGTENLEDRHGPDSCSRDFDERLPDAERVALRMSSALIVFDDVIASIVLRRTPRLYGYHGYLLGDGLHCSDETLSIDDVVGCPNGVLIEMGRMADIHAQTCGSLDALPLAERAATIKESLEAQFSRLTTPHLKSQRPKVFPVVDARLEEQLQLVARIWIHTAFLQLFMITPEREPNSSQVSFHANNTLALMNQLSPPSLLRALAWPLCVAGSLADRSHRLLVCSLMSSLQPRTLYGAVTKAYSIIQRMWFHRDVSEGQQDDFFEFLSLDEDLPLLV